MRDPSTDNLHEMIRELLAVSTIEALSADEELLVSEHLACCKACALAATEYKLITGYGRALPKIVKQPESEVAFWDSEKQKNRLLARLHSQEAQEAAARGRLWIGFPQFRLLQWAAVAVLTVAASMFVGYRMGVKAKATDRKGPDPISAQQVQRVEKSEQTSAKAELDTAGQRVAAAEKQIAELEAQLKSSETLRAELEAKNNDLAHQTSRDQRALETTAKQKTEIAESLAQKDKLIQGVQQQLNDLREQRSRELLRLASAEFRMQQVNSELAQKDQTIARQQQLLESDRDVRELMGARQLHIADVLDIDKDGKNRKPFGRIFYTKGKSLIFYAFDLDQQPGTRNASVFQAWGQSDSDSKSAVSLGIFYLDSQTNHRWIVKADSPELLSQLDAVFVTVEKNGASKRPTGKPFLYTYLRKGAPNHP